MSECPPRAYCPRPSHRALEDFAAGTESLAAFSGAWGALLPKQSDIEAAERTLEGLRRVLGELRQHVEGVTGADAELSAARRQTVTA